MTDASPTVGWIGIGRMGFAMAERLIKAGTPLQIWNRTRAKAEPLAKLGGVIRERPADLAEVDILFTMVSTGADVAAVLFGKDGVTSAGKAPPTVVDCSSISIEDSASIRDRLATLGASVIAAPVSGNAKVIKANQLSTVCSGPKAAFDEVKPLIETFAGRGVSYVGEGELARICKIAHNVMLGVVIQNFINNSVMGSMFTRYKSNALVNLDWTTTFTPALLRKDLDLGLAAARDNDVAMPVTAATREALQAHFGAAQLQDDPKGYLALDFAALLETVALQAGMTLKSENVPVPTGLEVADAG